MRPTNPRREPPRRPRKDEAVARLEDRRRCRTATLTTLRPRASSATRASQDARASSHTRDSARCVLPMRRSSDSYVPAPTVVRRRAVRPCPCAGVTKMTPLPDPVLLDQEPPQFLWHGGGDLLPRQSGTAFAESRDTNRTRYGFPVAKQVGPSSIVENDKPLARRRARVKHDARSPRWPRPAPPVRARSPPAAAPWGRRPRCSFSNATQADESQGGAVVWH